MQRSESAIRQSCSQTNILKWATAATIAWRSRRESDVYVERVDEVSNELSQAEQKSCNPSRTSSTEIDRGRCKIHSDTRGPSRRTSRIYRLRRCAAAPRNSCRRQTSRDAVGTSRRFLEPRNCPGRAAHCICAGWSRLGSGTRSEW